jgi:hypothetical protein
MIAASIVENDADQAVAGDKISAIAIKSAIVLR